MEFYIITDENNRMTGINSIRIGDSKENVRRQLKDDFRTFRRTGSENDSDSFYKGSLIVSYLPVEDMVDTIEVSTPGKLIYQNKNLFDYKTDQIKNILADNYKNLSYNKKDKTLVSKDYCFIFASLDSETNDYLLIHSQNHFLKEDRHE